MAQLLHRSRKAIKTRMICVALLSPIPVPPSICQYGVHWVIKQERHSKVISMIQRAKCSSPDPNMLLVPTARVYAPGITSTTIIVEYCALILLCTEPRVHRTRPLKRGACLTSPAKHPSKRCLLRHASNSAANALKQTWPYVYRNVATKMHLL